MTDIEEKKMPDLDLDESRASEQPEHLRSQILLVPTRELLAIAAVLWSAAGSMVVMVGLHATTNPWAWWEALGFVLTFAAFFALFLSIARKHVRRIMAMTDKLSFILKFFDIKSWFIMIGMITLGAAVRLSTFVPNQIIAFFYCGLGAALVFSGLYILINYLQIWSSRRFQQ
ncbi:MAG: hypothetical protein FWF30_03495 [Coriobacteriia bacterium]|nr:hypothetical protein [Coriobacteriia bacterium]